MIVEAQNDHTVDVRRDGHELPLELARVDLSSGNGTHRRFPDVAEQFNAGGAGNLNLAPEGTPGSHYSYAVANGKVAGHPISVKDRESRGSVLEEIDARVKAGLPGHHALHRNKVAIGGVTNFRAREKNRPREDDIKISFPVGIDYNRLGDIANYGHGGEGRNDYRVSARPQVVEPVRTTGIRRCRGLRRCGGVTAREDSQHYPTRRSVRTGRECAGTVVVTEQHADDIPGEEGKAELGAKGGPLKRSHYSGVLSRAEHGTGRDRPRESKLVAPRGKIQLGEAHGIGRPFNCCPVIGGRSGYGCRIKPHIRRRAKGAVAVAVHIGADA